MAQACANFLGLPDAILFLSILREDVFQHPRLVNNSLLVEQIMGVGGRLSAWVGIEVFGFFWQHRW